MQAKDFQPQIISPFFCLQPSSQGPRIRHKIFLFLINKKLIYKTKIIRHKVRRKIRPSWPQNLSQNPSQSHQIDPPQSAETCALGSGVESFAVVVLNNALDLLSLGCLCLSSWLCKSFPAPAFLVQIEPVLRPPPSAIFQSLVAASASAAPA